MTPHQKPEALLPPAAPDRGSGVRLTKSEDRNTDDIINRPGRSTHPEAKSVLRSEATPHIPSSTLVRRYELTYEAALSNTGLSRLQSIQECAGSTPECYPPTTFGHTNAPTGLDTEVTSGTNPIAPLAIDINGDGRTDIAYSSASGAGTWMYQLANTSGGFDAAVNSGIANTGYGQANAIDYNGDGKDDMLVPYSGTTWWAIQGSASGLLAPVNTSLSSTGTGASMAMDWNGDGRDDLVWATSSAYNQFMYVALRNSSGAGFAALTRIDTPPSPPGQWTYSQMFAGQNAKSRVRGMDFNGDGIRDFIYGWQNVWGGGSPPHVDSGTNVMLGAGKGIFQVSSFASGYYSSICVSADLNRDGYTDAICRDPGSSGLTYRLSGGANFAPPVTVAGYPSGGGGMLVRDWNGDGLADVLVASSTTNTWFVFLSTGTTLSAGTNTGVSTGSLSGWLPMDLNGDGLDDIGYIKSTGQWAVLPHATGTADLLNSVADGYGNTVAVSYLAITQGGYTTGTGATFPNKNFQGPIIAVRQVALSNGIGGTRTRTYDYTDARINVQSAWQNVFVEDGNGGLNAVPNPAVSRGLQSSLQDAGNVNQTQFIGFSSIKVTDSATTLETATDYSAADPPFTGLVTGQRIYQPGGTTPITTVSNTWVSKDAVGTDGTHYLLPYLQQSVTSEFEVAGTFNGALKRTTTQTLNTVDSYGTPTTATITATEPASGANGVQPGASYTTQTVLSSLQDSTATWCLGKPGQIQTTASHNQYGGTAITRTVTQAWDVTTLCRLNSETVEPLSAAYALTRSLQYDVRGGFTS